MPINNEQMRFEVSTLELPPIIENCPLGCGATRITSQALITTTRYNRSGQPTSHYRKFEKGLPGIWGGGNSSCTHGEQ